MITLYITISGGNPVAVSAGYEVEAPSELELHELRRLHDAGFSKWGASLDQTAVDVLKKHAPRMVPPGK